MSTGKIGAADLAAGVDTLLGMADENMVINVCLVNRGNTFVKVRLAIGAGTTPGNTDYLEYDTIMLANGVLERTGIVISSGEKIWVRTDTATVSARAHGLPAV